MDVGDVQLFVTDSLSNLILNEKECVQNAHIIKPPSLDLTILPKNECSKQLVNTKQKSPEKSIKHLSNVKEKSPEKNAETLSSKLELLRHTIKTTHVIKKSPVVNYLLNPTMIGRLIIRFENSVNFIRPRRLQSIVDIDSIVRSFSIFGKVASIQDHWTRPKGKSVCDLSFACICF